MMSINLYLILQKNIQTGKTFRTLIRIDGIIREYLQQCRFVEGLGVYSLMK